MNDYVKIVFLRPRVSPGACICVQKPPPNPLRRGMTRGAFRRGITRFIVLTMIYFWYGGLSVNAQDTLTVRIKPESTLTIHGKTNVNSFTCSQTHIPRKESRDIILIQAKDNIHFENAELSIPVDEFDCGHKIMTRDFQEILETEKYPNLYVILHSVRRNKDETYSSEVSIKLAGVTRRYHIPIKIYSENDRLLVGAGQKEVGFGEFNLEPPVKFMGMVKVREELTISFTIRIQHIP
jgi:hypothetical protein